MGSLSFVVAVAVLAGAAVAAEVAVLPSLDVFGGDLGFPALDVGRRRGPALSARRATVCPCCAFGAGFTAGGCKAEARDACCGAGAGDFGLSDAFGAADWDVEVRASRASEAAAAFAVGPVASDEFRWCCGLPSTEGSPEGHGAGLTIAFSLSLPARTSGD